MIASFKSWLKERTPPRAWGLGRRLLQRARPVFYSRRVVRHTYAGKELRLVLTDPIAYNWYNRDWKMAPEFLRLQEHRLRPGALVFNLGAHQCVVAMILAEAVGKTGKVVAVEASARNAAIGEQNRKLNGYEDLQILSAAVGERSGKLTFTAGDHVHRGDDHEGRIMVDAFSIDDLAVRHGAPDVVFMDIEGYELNALRGARHVLEMTPDWFVEVHAGGGLESYGGCVEDVLSFFAPEKYERMVRSNADEEFVHLDPADRRLRDRFFLLALARG